MLHLGNFWRSPKSLLFMSNGPQDLKVFLLTMHKSRLVICHASFILEAHHKLSNITKEQR